MNDQILKNICEYTKNELFKRFDNSMPSTYLESFPDSSKGVFLSVISPESALLAREGELSSGISDFKYFSEVIF